MKIGINALFLKTPASGTGQYLLHLLRALAEVDTTNEYVLLGPPLQGSTYGDPARFDGLPFPYIAHTTPSMIERRENTEKLVWEQWTGPAAARAANVDLYHVPHFAPPYLPRTPTVVTIHDVIPLLLPAYRAGASVGAYMRLVTRAAHKATLIITVSQHAKQDIVDVLHIRPDRIRVIYEAAGDEFVPVRDPVALADARARYGVGDDYIFYIGGLDQRKNVPQLVRAFAHLYHQLKDERPGLQLFISGDPERQRGPLFPDPRPIAAELDVSDRVVFGFVEDADKAAILSAAQCFVFPATYEGFGLPPLEAMACGAPVVCSNRTSLPEVVGDAALSVDPDDTGALANALRDVLTNDALREDLRARSLRRAAWFSWRKTARETVAAYEEALARSKSQGQRQRQGQEQ
mgnify:CR=1 FL=1